MPKFIVTEISAPMTLKEYLCKQCKISLTLWHKIKFSRSVKRNDVLLNYPERAIVRAGDEILWSIVEKSSIEPEELPLALVYEDDYLLVANKPCGQLVHPTAKERSHTLANAVLQHYQDAGLSAGYHPVHRLDRNTSGLVLIAKQPHIQHYFSFETEKKSLRRYYLAVVAGLLSPPSGRIDLPIGRRPGSIIERMVADDGKKAVTLYRTLQTFCDSSFIELELLTGRTHQIRVHLSHCGHPLLGDELYGGSQKRIHRQALHAARLEFFHPVAKETIRLTAPLPADMRRLLVQENTQT